MLRYLIASLLLALGACLSPALAQEAAAPKVSMLVITGAYYFPGWPGLGDFDIFKELVEKHNIQVDVWVNDKERALDWDLIRKYNALVIINPPDRQGQPFHHGMWIGPPDKAAFDEMLQRYLAAGGGVFWLLFSENYPVQYNLYNDYLMPFGAKLMLEELHDPQTEAIHPRLQQPFIYADDVPPQSGQRGRARGLDPHRLQLRHQPHAAPRVQPRLDRGAQGRPYFLLPAAFAALRRTRAAHPPLRPRGQDAPADDHGHSRGRRWPHGGGLHLGHLSSLRG